MKKIILKSIILIPALIFMIFLIMTIIGCTSCLFGLDEVYYSSTYCDIFKTVTLIAIIGYFTVLFLDMKFVYKNSFTLKN